MLCRCFVPTSMVPGRSVAKNSKLPGAAGLSLNCPRPQLVPPNQRSCRLEQNPEVLRGSPEDRLRSAWSLMSWLVVVMRLQCYSSRDVWTILWPHSLCQGITACRYKTKYSKQETRDIHSRRVQNYATNKRLNHKRISTYAVALSIVSADGLLLLCTRTVGGPLINRWSRWSLGMDM